VHARRNNVIDSLTIRGGFDKDSRPEEVREVTIRRGEIVGVVGPTGSGKSSLIADIEQLAQGDTPTRRRVLVNGREPLREERTDPKKKIVAELSQNMNFLANMSVGDFLRLHAKCRRVDLRVEDVIELANGLTGEPIREDEELTILSGGQSRALMVADVAVISDSPIVLVDEIENAGIKKHDALKLLSGHGKIVLVVTHDPVLALMAERRIIMKLGGMSKVTQTSRGEKLLAQRLRNIDEWMLTLRDLVREGELIENIPHGAPMREIMA
jgi:ABC-type lipoprotein export system ATPase subunit